MYYLKFLYIFFLVLALNIFFFSTTNTNAKAFLIDEIQVSEKLENNFNKEALINQGFEKAFNELISTLVKSTDLNKTANTSLNKIKSMIETFTIKEEKFVNKVYYLNLGVSFNKKKIFSYLEKKNIFPSQIVKNKFLFIPIIIDQQNNDVLIFSNNPIYKSWNEVEKKHFLIQYLLATEDLEDFSLIKKNSLDLENYDFKEIIEKYYLDHSIVALISKDNDEIKILSKIYIEDKKVIKNNKFKKINFNNKENIQTLIDKLKIIYEDLWKDHNIINTSIKLPLRIRVNNNNLNISIKFEETLNNIDLINNYYVSKFDKDYIFYEIIFNGTPKSFINIMRDQNYIFDTQKKIWILK
jgi:hypothetical protein